MPRARTVVLWIGTNDVRTSGGRNRTGSENTLDRRLSAIVAADVVGFSRLIRRDEAGTLTALRAVRAEVVDVAIAANRGRIVKLMGDGLLAEFASAVDAVSAAHAVQAAMPGWNAAAGRPEPIVFRVGVNLGDVVIDGDDIHGDGVNLAARLEAVCTPGGIAVSDAVHDQVRDRLDLGFADRGPQELKNIDRPVRVWEWSGAARPEVEAAPPLPAKPSIAVLPFDNMSGDPEQVYFADGIVEDVITALSRNRNLFVIARNSSFSYRGQSVDIRQVGRDLGVRFVLEGSVRRAGNQVRITAQLIEAATGAHVWAERYDRPVTDIFAVQDEITVNVAGAVGSEIITGDMRKAGKASVEALAAWERMMKASWHIHRYTAGDTRICQAICRAEIAKDDTNALPHALLAFACVFDLIWTLTDRPPAENIADATRSAQRAIALDPDDDNGHAALGFLAWVTGDHMAAEAAARRAIDINPNGVWGNLILGLSLGYAGADRYEAAMESLRHTVRVGPRDIAVTWPYAHMAAASFISEKYDDAVKFAQVAIRHNPDNGTAYRFMAAGLAMQGRIDAAQQAWARAWAVQPLDLAAFQASAHRFFAKDADAERFVKALRLAGAPTV